MAKRVQKQYTNEDIRRAAGEFALKGKFSAVERSLNIPRQTLQSWAKNSEVWNTTLSETRHEKDQAPATNLTKPNGNTIGTDISVEKGSKYTNQQRREAVVEYGIHGNMTKVEEVTGIPDSTLSHWKHHTDWWDTLLGEVRNEISDRILPQNLQIAERAGERVLDSLKNGDEKLVWDKAKNEYVIKRVKPTGKEASVMGGIAQDKARVQLNLPTSISSNQSSEEAIKALVKQFEEISDAYTEREAKVIDEQ